MCEVELSQNPKVRQLDFPFAVQQDVVRFDIVVNLAVVVQLRQALEYLVRQIGDT